MIERFKQWLHSNSRKQERKTVDAESQVPRHVAIIMDGNGRWAKKRNLPRIAGHREGMKTIREVTRMANELGISILTLYAFSTENWKRPSEEVDSLMKLPQEFLETELEELKRHNIRLYMIGNEERLPEYTKRAVDTAKEQTKNNTGLILNFALNYGGRQELEYAIQRIAGDLANGSIKEADINENLIPSYLYTGDLGDPDLLVRTSGEVRISNFMLWQLAYTELWFTDTLWPDFSAEDFQTAIRNFQQRKRRYGAV